MPTQLNHWPIPILQQQATMKWESKLSAKVGTGWRGFTSLSNPFSAPHRSTMDNCLCPWSKVCPESWRHPLVVPQTECPICADCSRLEVSDFHTAPSSKNLRYRTQVTCAVSRKNRPILHVFSNGPSRHFVSWVQLGSTHRFLF